MNYLKSTLTPVQLAVYNFVLACIRTEHMPPTRAEVRDHFGWKSATAAQDVLYALARKGFVEITPGKARGIRIRRLGGTPTLPTSDPEGNTVPASLETPLGTS